MFINHFSILFYIVFLWVGEETKKSVHGPGPLQLQGFHSHNPISGGSMDLRSIFYPHPGGADC